MLKNKYLLLGIVPLFAAGFLISSLFANNKVSIQQHIAKADPQPLLTGPQQVSLVTAPPVVETEPAPEPVVQPAPQPVAKITPKTTAPAPKPRVQTSTTTVTPAPLPSPSCSGGFATQFICLLNKYRASKGLRPLTYSSSISTAAYAHSVWMNTTGIFSHQETDGSRMSDRCAAAGTVCHAENLAQGAASPQNLLDMWKASGSHNANLLGPYSLIGIGISGSYITADFN